MTERKKINMFQEHFANIEASFLWHFEQETRIINIIQFIKESAYKDFGIYLYTKEDMLIFEDFLSTFFYKNKTEWLREKMRQKLLEKTKRGGLK